MRISIASVVLGSLMMLGGACQRAGDAAEESARKVAERAPAPIATPAPTVTPAPGAAAPLEAPAPIAEPSTEPSTTHSCGGAGGCGASCNGQCGGSCGGAMTAEAGAAKPVPADADWQALQVEGMRCGGCARRIQTALAQVDGVVGSEVDLGTHTVRVAVKKGVDARQIAAPAIDKLGYRVVR
jgi:copper chaperone CopZ